ncbi:MAG: hypothetical protein ABIV28_06225 [Longimicrobiales bacterium]
MNRLVGGWALVGLAAFMLMGFFRANVDGGAGFMALAITVLLPGAAGISMIAGHYRGGARVRDRKTDLRQQTMEAELLRCAELHGGKLTIVEAVRDLAITPEEAKHALDALSLRGMAEFEVTESGVVVYAFHDLQRLDEKNDARGILE